MRLLFRLVFPAWGFFNRSGTLPWAFFRRAESGDSWKALEIHGAAPAKGFKNFLNLIFNPETNLDLFLAGLPQRIAEASTSSSQIYEIQILKQKGAEILGLPLQHLEISIHEL